MTPAPELASPVIERLMREAFIDQKIAPGLFWQATLFSRLVLPLGNSDDREQEPEHGDRTPVLLGVNERGDEVIWVFTSIEALREYVEENPPYARIPAASIFGWLKEVQHDVWLIGREGLSLELDSRLIASLADGKVPEPPGKEV